MFLKGHKDVKGLGGGGMVWTRCSWSGIQGCGTGYGKLFESDSISSSYSVIVRERIVLKITVFGD